MKKIAYLLTFGAFFFMACSDDDSSETTDPTETTTPDNSIPVVHSSATYTVLKEEDISYAEGLSHNGQSTTPFAIPIKLDLYYPDNDATTRPVFLFIHGGGFQGGTKTKPEIVNMANYFVARGWVFASIDYRTVEELGNINGMTPEQLLTYHKGIAPQTWMEFALAEAESPDDVQTSIAMYTAQRDAKAALRWLVANANTYNIDTDYISIGGASAGSITTVALGISDPSDFRDEISLTDDPTLATTNLSATYDIKSMIHFWGSNVKLELFEAIYGMDRYDSNDPELFMAHGTGEDPVTPFSEAEELEGIYNSLGVHNELVPLIDWGHGAWGAQVDGKSLSDLSFDFIVARQQLSVE